MKKALYFEDISDGDIQCNLCPYQCAISPSKQGQCGVRINKNGELYTRTYGRISAMEMVPIETLPLYHFHPGEKTLLIGTQGCTMRCPFCNAWRYSQAGTRTFNLSPEEIVDAARKKGAGGVAFGVNEAALDLEYIIDSAPLIHEAGMYVIMATNGFMQTAPLFEVLKYTDAVIVGIKGLNDKFHAKVCGGFRSEILNNVISMNIKTYLELSLIIIQGQNDDEKEFEDFLQWMSRLHPKPPPLHLLQYQPAFQYKYPATDPMIMFYLQEKARRILPHVYLSNMTEREANATYCPSCKVPLILREQGSVVMENLNGSTCKKCGNKIPLIL
ncbi:radical SAM protein [Candidatus Sumerlaeota bacterium]|nr:radical SAM protein [Candidatus Sumerlaeota bacterium]